MGVRSPGSGCEQTAMNMRAFGLRSSARPRYMNSLVTGLRVEFASEPGELRPGRLTRQRPLPYGRVMSSSM
jgi:hypothetical protein